jgi:hypothetical protein
MPRRRKPQIYEVLPPRERQVPLDGVGGLTADATVIEGKETKDRKGGRPGIGETIIEVWHRRRQRGVPVHRFKLDEARAIRQEWPVGIDEPRKPKAKSIADSPELTQLHAEAMRIKR